MKNKDAKIFLEALTELENEKGILKSELLEAVEQALLVAYKKNFGNENENIKITINRDTGNVEIFETKRVVEKDVIDSFHEIDLESAKKIRKRSTVGSEIDIPVKSETFRRNAILNGKQIVIQKVREAERKNIYNKFKAYEKDVINGIIRRIDLKGNVFIEFDGIELMLPLNEQSPADNYVVDDRIKVYVALVEETSKFPKIIISRKHEEFISKLFSLEIPEIEAGAIKIHSVSREAGSRSKIAVYSSDENIATVGACIGQRGLRIKEVVNELNGEKIDIVEWNEEKTEFIKSALNPAKIEQVTIDSDENVATVFVSSDQLSLAIGKNGQNVRLAARLTESKIDIKTY